MVIATRGQVRSYRCQYARWDYRLVKQVLHADLHGLIGNIFTAAAPVIKAELSVGNRGYVGGAHAGGPVPRGHGK